MRRRLAIGVAGLIAAALGLLFAQSAVEADSVPLSISISGNHFVNGSGQTIRLLGVDHASSEYACAEGWGYNDGHQDDADAAAIAAWHANAVRIPLNEDCWLGINGQPNSSLTSETLTQAGYQQAVVNYVSALNAHGIYAILDLHWTAPGTQVALEQQPMPDEAHSPGFWTSVAARFKSDPAVVFDLFNEPYDPTDPRSGSDGNSADAVSWNCWDTGTENGPAGGAACSTEAYDGSGNATSRYAIAGLKTLVNSIRSTGATQPIMVGGLNFANDLSQWASHAPDDPLNQEAASFHNYSGQDCATVTCWDATVAPVAANVPVVTGEFDEDDYLNSSCSDHTPSSFDGDYMIWADQHGVSYLAWGWELLDSSEISAQGCSAYFLTSDTGGTPAAPNGTSLHDHLAALAAPPATTTTSTTTAQGPTAPTAPTAPNAPTAPTAPTAPVPAVALTQFKVRIASGGETADFRLRATQACSGVLSGQTVGEFTARAKKRRQPVMLGSVRFKLAAGRTRSVALKLSAKARTLLASRRSLAVRMTVTLTAAGGRSVIHRNATLRLPAPRRKG